jgi:drug/metabolite transporter (DMT)-like permease
MKDNSEKLKGEIYVFFSLFFWACFPVLASFSGAKLPGLVFLTWTILVGIIFFFCILVYKGLLSELSNKLFWKYAFYIALLNGGFFYVFYFLGLERTTPNNVSLLGQTEILFSLLFFNVLRKEHISGEHKAGIALMVLGALLVLLPNFSHFNIGDFFIVIAFIVGPIGNHFQQKVRKVVSAETALFGRNLISLPIIFPLSFLLEKNVSYSFPTESVIIILLNGILILGFSRIFWMEGLHRVSVTKATAMGAMNPLTTMVMSWLILHQAPTLIQLTAFIPLFIGLMLLTDNIKLKAYSLIP